MKLYKSPPPVCGTCKETLSLQGTDRSMTLYFCWHCHEFWRRASGGKWIGPNIRGSSRGG